MSFKQNAITGLKTIFTILAIIVAAAIGITVIGAAAPIMVGGAFVGGKVLGLLAAVVFVVWFVGALVNSAKRFKDKRKGVS